MGIFDDLEGAASDLLRPVKKANKATKGLLLGSASPVIGIPNLLYQGSKATVDLLGVDNVMNYVLPTLAGAGFGAAVGAPAGGVGAIPGAIIGGTTALASTILGPKAGHAVGEATGVDELGTAAEFGVYGLAGGVGLGNAGSQVAVRTAGKVGMERLLAHMALKSSLEMGALSGVGAATGQGAAKAAGLPEELGIAIGGLGGPVLGPGAFQGVRGAMYRTDNPALKTMAENFGANEGNSLRRNRVIDMRRSVVQTDAHQDMIKALDRSIAQDQINVARYSPEQTEPYYRLATGGYNRNELLTRERGHNLPEVAEITTPAFNNARARLRTRQGAIEQSSQILGETEGKYAADAFQVPPGGELKPNPVYQKQTGRDASSQSWFVKDEQGVEHLIPDGEVDAYTKGPKTTWIHTAEDGTESLVSNAAATARMQMDNAARLHGENQSKLAKLLGVAEDAIPADAHEQELLLRNKFMPDYETKLTEAQKALMEMSPEEARTRRLTGDASAAQYKADTQVKYANSARAMAEKLAFKDWALANQSLGAVRSGDVADAARAFAAVNQQVDMAAKYGTHGYTAAREPMEPFEKYYQAAHFVATPHAPENQQLIKDGFLSSPRGQMVETDGSIVKPIKVLEVDERRKLASVRAPNEPDDMARDIPWDKIAVRYRVEPPVVDAAGAVVNPGIDQVAMRNNELEGARRDLFKTFKGRIQRDRIQEEYAKLHRPVPAVDEKISAEQMASDLDTSRKDFMNKFMPTSIETQGKYLTPEHEAMMIAGEKNFFTKGMKMNMAKGKSDAVVQAIQYRARAFQDRIGDYLSVDDVGLLDAYNAAPQDSPMKSIIMMAGKNPNDYLKLIDSNGGVNLTGSTGQTMRRLAIGESVQSAPLRALLADHYGALEAHAVTAGGLYQPIHNMLENVAAELLGIPEGAGPQFRNAGKALASEGIHPLRALKAAASELHPLSKAGSFAKLLEKNVDWNVALKAPDSKLELSSLGRGLKYVDEHYPEQSEMVRTLLLQDKATFEQYPEMFGQLVNEPRIASGMKAFRALNEDLRNGGIQSGLAPDTEARIWAMQVSPDARSWLDRDVIRAGTGTERIKDIFAGKATKVDVAIEVLRAMEKQGINKPLSEMMVWGREADMARPVGMMQSMALSDTMGKLAKMADRAVTPDDLVFRGGTYTINSKNKWPAEIARDLGGFNDIIAGNHKWAGLQKVSQQIAYGNLAADLSLVGIQGYKYLAHSLLAGNGLEAVKNFGGLVKVESGTGDVVKKQMNTVTSHIMSDHGFYSWLRTNMDEIQYYSTLGLTGGLKGYIAGPDVRKLPLESIPLLGKAFTGIREGTDLQFNRQLYYWKVQGVRENLEVAKSLRTAGRDFAQHYINSNPNMQPMVDELGGLDGYLLGEKEDVVKAVVRQVNRGMGGVSMDAEGIGVNRQALEQIMMIVPGFFRAQVGQWASIITKPNTIEGQLAMSMLSREYLFAAGVATGLSRLMGTNESMNYSDMSKPTWLGIPLPDGNTVNLLPTMALPRLASRVIKNAVMASEGKADFNPTTALDAFARGRLSPLVATAYETSQGEDFLGRKYTDNREKYGMALANLALPIVMSSAVEDIKESFKHNGEGLGMNWQDFAESTGINILGKGMIPQQPQDKLDKAAQAQFGTDWNLLTDAEKTTMRESPAILGAEAEWNFYSMRRAGTTEQQVDSAYSRYATTLKQIWEEPRSIGNFKSTQTDDDQSVAAGTMPGDVWRERYHTRQQAAAERFKYLDDELHSLGVDPDQIRADKMQRLREGRDPGSIAYLVQAAKTEYAGVEPGTKEQKLATPSGEVTVEATNWDQFQADREAVLARYPAAVAERVRKEDNSQTPGIASYRQASEMQKAIESLPRYRGLTAEQGDRLDQMQTVMVKLADKVKGQMGLPPGTAVPGLSEGIRRAAVGEMQKLGIVRNQDDLQLASVAIMMQENPKFADTLRNPEQVRAILQSPMAVIFYPYLRSRVPKQLWPQLPAQVFNAPLVQAELNASGG